MLLEEIASQILVDTKRFKTKEEALSAFRNEFTLHFPNKDYSEWNKSIPASMAQNIITNVGKNGAVSIRFLIKDLQTITNVL